MAESNANQVAGTLLQSRLTAPADLTIQAILRGQVSASAIGRLELILTAIAYWIVCWNDPHGGTLS